MKIGVFGGTFNPPHFAHYFIYKHLLNSRLVDRVIFVPSFKHPFKPEIEESYLIRLKMIEHLTDHEDKNSCEILHEPLLLKPEHQGKTFFLMKKIDESYSHNHPHLVIGTDILEEKHKWFNFQGIEANWPIIVYGRQNYRNANIAVPIEFPNISSSKIRKMIDNGENVSNLIPQRVLEYIKQYNIYGINNGK